MDVREVESWLSCFIRRRIGNCSRRGTALVGMGYLFADIIHAPMTSVFLIFELTQNYQSWCPWNMLWSISVRRQE